MSEYKVFDWRISMGNILVAIGMSLGGLWFLADVDKSNALQDARIEANRTALKESIEAERAARKEALQDLRIRMDADRTEMRQQFDKLNGKIDELIKQSK